MQPSAFISVVAPIAVELRLEGSPLLPSVRIAQAGLETGWKIHSWNNLVGFKTGSGQTNEYWRGAYITKPTWEVYGGKRTNTTADFRVYDNIADGFRDQDVLFMRPRYERVRLAETPEAQAQALQASGYATDPSYANKIINVINNYGLKRFDKEAEEMKLIVEQLVEKVNQLEEQVKQLEEKEQLPEIPEWAVESVNAAVAAGIIDTPNNGSYDFYRLLTVLHRKNLI